MGLFSFIKEAGAKLFGSNKKEEKAVEVVDTCNEDAANKLKETVVALGLEVEAFDACIDGDVVTLTGMAKNQETKEKVILVAGNNEGIATVDDQMEVEIQEPEAQFHTVERGDTLSKIAKTYYGNAMKYPAIFEANKPMLKSPDLIYPGQVLRIPELS
ncbi:MAG: peptidoglycan-binding protein LysM [Flavobacteriales bacterium]|jgi:nucleoid-associated protein YgaU|nr:peptidoglycan-binding protein LysM [Flavobacteriales bacterium]